MTISQIEIAKNIHAHTGAGEWHMLTPKMQEAYVACAIKMAAKHRFGENATSIARAGHEELARYAKSQKLHFIASWESTRAAWIGCAEWVVSVLTSSKNKADPWAK